MDVEIFYAGDCRIECSFSRMSAGIKDFTVSGWLWERWTAWGPAEGSRAIRVI